MINDKINKATIDILNELSKEDVFGLKLWNLQIIDKSDLEDIHKFGVNFVFSKYDFDIVMNLIDEYKNEQISYLYLIYKFYTLSIYICNWR